MHKLTARTVSKSHIFWDPSHHSHGEEGLVIAFTLAGAWKPRDALRFVHEALEGNSIHWLTPEGDIWRLDLDQLGAWCLDLAKSTDKFRNFLAGERWLKGTHVVPPEISIDEILEGRPTTKVEFALTKDCATKKADSNAKKKADSNRVLIIHGHDDRNLFGLKDLLQNKLQLPEPVIMKQQMVPGASLPEKFEQLAASVGFAVALLTPDDRGRALADAELQPRPRQNTLVEIGWFWGRLGRDRILVLVQGKLELPSDLQGVEVYRFQSKVEEVSEKVRDFFEAHRKGDEGGA